MRAAGVRIGMVLGAMAVVGPAAAAGAVPLDGPYGNAPGCAFYFTGKPGRDMVLITPYTGLLQPTGCVFKSAVTEGDTIVVTGSCSAPGEKSVTGEILKLRVAGGNLTVYDGVQVIGPLPRCTQDDSVNV
jgi:hypothetical protein